jgi:hypothetical protein
MNVDFVEQGAGPTKPHVTVAELTDATDVGRRGPAAEKVDFKSCRSLVSCNREQHVEHEDGIRNVTNLLIGREIKELADRWRGEEPAQNMRPALDNLPLLRQSTSSNSLR